MEYKKVSVLIPAYNASAFIEETIASVLGQTWPNLEIIVVDDGSRDDTLVKAQHYMRAGVRVASQFNAGASEARNHAFSLATGDYIQYLDADDLLHPDKIRTQMDALRSQTNGVLAASAWGMFYDTPDEQVFQPTLLWRDYADPAQWLLDAWENGVWMQPSAWLTHRSLIESAGPWDEQLSLHDDGEFFCRVLLKSMGIIFCETAKSFYRKGIDNSLSSIRGPKAALSHLRVCESYERHLLQRRRDAETMLACANNYQRLIYDVYPNYESITAQAAAHVVSLGGSSAKPTSTPLFKAVDKVLGWKLSKRLQNIVYRYKLNPASWRNN